MSPPQTRTDVFVSKFVRYFPQVCRKIGGIFLPLLLDAINFDLRRSGVILAKPSGASRAPGRPIEVCQQGIAWFNCIYIRVSEYQVFAEEM